MIMKTIKFLLMMLGLVSFSAMATPATFWAYIDNDHDGHASKLQMIAPEEMSTFLSRGWHISPDKPPIDCDDTNDMLFNNTKLWVDNDGDKYANDYALICMGTTVPSGYIKTEEKLGADCDDADPLVWRNLKVFKDTDGDKWAGDAGTPMCVGVTPPGFVSINDVLGYNDCDDNDPLVWRVVGLLYDGDGDLYVVKGTPLTPTCMGLTPPAKYILPETRKGISDCNDADPTVWRGVCAKPIGSLGPNVSLCIGDAFPPGYGPCVPPPEADPATFSVYPNPATDRIFLTPEQGRNERVVISLVDPFGRTVRTMNSASAIKGQRITIPTGDLKPGIYKLTVKCGDLLETKSIAIKL